MKLNIPISIRDDYKDLIFKALNNLQEYGLSDLKWVREYQIGLCEYYNDVFRAIMDGIALNMGVNPSELKKSFKIPVELLLKNADGKGLKEGMIYKSLWEDFKNKYDKSREHKYKQFKINNNQQLKPIRIDGKVIYNPISRELLTNGDWDKIGKNVEDFLGETDLEHNMVIRAGLFGLLKMKMDEEGIPLKKIENMSWEEVEKKYSKVFFSKQTELNEINKNRKVRSAIDYAKVNAGEFLSIKNGKIKNDIIDVIRRQTTLALREGISQAELANRLVFSSGVQDVEELNRDYRRIAITETSYAMNNGYLAAWSEENEGKDLYFVFTVNKNACPSCKKFEGKICRLKSKPEKSDGSIDSKADFDIWEGKNNVGRKSNEYWCACPLHPNCCCKWEKINPDIEYYDKDYGILLKVEKSMELNLDLKKSKSILVNNFEWSGEIGQAVKTNLKNVTDKIKKIIPLKSKVIVHLYTQGDEGQIGEHSEGIINLYGNGGDYVDTYIHELSHIIYHEYNLDKDNKLNKELFQLKEYLNENKQYNKLFDNPHIRSNIKELFVTILKWYLMGRIIDNSYTEVLKKYCPQSIKMIEDAFDKDIKKSFLDIIKAFIKPPRTAEGKIDFKRVPVGSTIWITRNGSHIPITKFNKEKFGVDFQAARNAGYNIQGDKKQSHLVFKLSGNKIKDKKDQTEHKELTEKQKQKREEKEQIKTKKKEIKTEIKKNVSKSKKELLKFVTNENKKESVLSDLYDKVDDYLKENRVNRDQRETYLDVIMKEANKKDNDQKIKDLINFKKGKEVDFNKKDFLNLHVFKDVEDNFDLINKIKDGLGEEGHQIKFNVGVDKKVLKVDEDELKNKLNQFEKNVSVKNKFDKENTKVKKIEDLLKIDIEGLKVNDEDMKQAEKVLLKNKGNLNGKSLYTVLANFGDETSLNNIDLLKNKSGYRQINALLNSYAGITVDFQRMVNSLGIDKSVQLVSMYLKNELSKTQFNKLQENVSNYYENEVEKIEDNALNKLEGLRSEAKNLKTKMTQGKVFDQEAEGILNKNLIDQRNVIGSALGILQTTSLLLESLKKVDQFKDLKKVEVNLDSDPERAMQEYKEFTFYNDRKNVDFKSSNFGNKMTVGYNSITDHYIKGVQVDKDKINKLNKIKNNSSGVFKDKDGNEYTRYKINKINEDFKFRPAQRNDIEFLKVNGGKGIISRGVGGGKTMTAVGFHASNLEKNSKYSTIMVIPDKGVRQQADEIRKLTGLKIVEISEDLSAGEKKRLINSEKAEGKIFVISHSDLNNNTDLISKKNFTNLTIDELHEIFFDKNGDMKSKGQEIIGKIKTEHRIALTATPVQNSPSDVYNLINWVDPQGVGKRGNFRVMFGDKEKYNIDGKEKIGNYSISNIHLGEQNLMRQYFRDVVDNYVTNDNFVKRNYKVFRKDVKYKVPTEINKQLQKGLIGVDKQINKFVNETTKSFKENYPASWKDRRKQMFIDKFVGDQIKLSNKLGNEHNPKTKALIKNIQEKIGEKHVIYVDDIDHENIIRGALKKMGYEESNIFSMLGSKKSSNENKFNWIKKEKPALLFISKGQVSGHNLQSANTLHKVGTVLDGMTDIQVNGRVPRGNRKEDAHIIDYQFDSVYENNIRKNIEEYKNILSSIDSSILNEGGQV